MGDNFHLKKNFTGKNIVPQYKSTGKTDYSQFAKDEVLATKKQQAGKYKNRRRKLIKGVMNRPGAFVNNTGNARSGKSYFVPQAKGGTWHTYDNGKRVFVKRKNNA